MSETPAEDRQDPDHLREHGQPQPDEDEAPDSIEVQAEPSEQVSKHGRSGDLEEKEQPERPEQDED